MLPRRGMRQRPTRAQGARRVRGAFDRTPEATLASRVASTLRRRTIFRPRPPDGRREKNERSECKPPWISSATPISGRTAHLHAYPHKAPRGCGVSACYNPDLPVPRRAPLIPGCTGPEAFLAQLRGSTTSSWPPLAPPSRGGWRQAVFCARQLPPPRNRCAHGLLTTAETHCAPMCAPAC